MTDPGFEDEQGEPKELSPREKITAVTAEAFDAIRETAANFADAEVKATAMSFEQDFQRLVAMSGSYEFTLEDSQKVALAAWAAEGLGKIKDICEMNQDNADVKNTALSFERLFREVGTLAG